MFFSGRPARWDQGIYRGGDDYTVNIGLIAGGVPRLGVVFAPARAALHGGLVGHGAWLEQGGARTPIATRQPGAELTAVASKSHFNQATADYLDQAARGCGHVAVGSSLKFCIVAEGRADIYPRLSPTSEWDTAAGHAVLLAAGGRVDGPDGQPLRYGKRAFLNRGFVATGGWPPPRLALARRIRGVEIFPRVFRRARHINIADGEASGQRLVHGDQPRAARALQPAPRRCSTRS